MTYHFQQTLKEPLWVLLDPKHILYGVNPYEVFTCYKLLHGAEPQRDSTTGRCIYSNADLRRLLEFTTTPATSLRSLKEWKSVLPLAASLSSRKAIARLIALADHGWLSRCSYNGRVLYLCEADAERICYIRKTAGYGETPIRWSLPPGRP